MVIKPGMKAALAVTPVTARGNSPDFNEACLKDKSATKLGGAASCVIILTHPSARPSG